MNIAEWLEAARAGDLRPLEARVAQGLDVNLASARGRKALHEAAIAGQRAFIAALVAAGASLEPRDSNQMTPLMSACLRGGDPAEAGSLAPLEAGAAPNPPRADDRLTPLAAPAGRRPVRPALLPRPPPRPPPAPACARPPPGPCSPP